MNHAVKQMLILTRRLIVLIACEFSGIVRTEFARLGHNAVSADLRENIIMQMAGNTQNG